MTDTLNTLAAAVRLLRSALGHKDNISIADEALALIAQLQREAGEPTGTAPRGTDAQILKERELTASAIRGAIAFGAQGDQPPTDERDLWLGEFWRIGRDNTALRDVADAVVKQFYMAGYKARIGSPNPAEDLMARAVIALGGTVEREHIASAACWCEPTVEHKDPDTGVAVIVHRRVQ